MDRGHPPLNWQNCVHILNIFNALNLSISDFLVKIIQSHQDLEAHHLGLVQDLFNRVGDVFFAFARHPYSTKSCAEYSLMLSTEILRREVYELTDKSSGFHFNAKHASPDQIKEFASGEINRRIKETAPQLWTFVQSLLRARPTNTTQKPPREEIKRQKILDVVSHP